MTRIKRKTVFLIIGILSLFACEKKHDQFYSFYRVYFPNSYMTLNGAVLKTQALPDKILATDTGEAITPYVAVIQGQFEAVYDTIIQHGHVWSMTNPNPIIKPIDTSNYSRLGSWPSDSSGTFFTKINHLYPNTPFYARSYIITINGDTGYNPVVLIDTTLKATDTWFRAPELPTVASIRTGAVAVSYYDPNKDYQIGIIAGGNNANAVLDDMWAYDPQKRCWTQMSSLPYCATQAIGFVLSYTNEAEEEFTKLYYGTGETSPYGSGQTDKWYEYDFSDNTWSQTISKCVYPLKISRAVAFSIDHYGYVAFGKTENGNSTTAIYRFDPIEADHAHGSPWKLMPILDGKYARYDAIAFVIDSAAFIGLGQKNETQFWSDLWAFVPNSTTGGYWYKKASLPAGPRAQAVAFTINKYGFVGLGYNTQAGFKDFYKFDPFANKWEKIKNYMLGPDYKGEKQATRDAVAIGLGDIGLVGCGYKVYDSLSPYCKDFWFYQP